MIIAVRSALEAQKCLKFEESTGIIITYISVKAEMH